MAVTPSYHVAGLLEKMTNVDKDFRYMAVNDLMAELNKSSITFGEDMEKKIVRALLNLVQDKDGEVQNLACRCLGPLVHKIKLPQVEALLDSLCANMTSPNEQLPDVSSIALKAVLNELPASTTNQQIYICAELVISNFVKTLKSNNDSSVKLEVLDVLAILISKYGRNVNLHFDEVELVLIQLLEGERQALKKRAITALSHLTDVISDEQFQRIVERILSAFANNDDLGYFKTFILTSIAICRSSPGRLARYIPKIMPILIKKCKEVDDDELRENCLQAFETFIFHCTAETEPYIQEISALSAQFLSYDPNYNYSEEEVDQMETDNDTDEPEEQEDYSNDDDLTWKVRRAAAKTIEASISYRPDALGKNYETFGHLLINRFKEREENVKYDIFTAYSALLKLTKQVVPELASFQAQSIYGANDYSPEFFLPTRFHQLQNELNEKQKEIFAKLGQQVPQLMKALQREIKGKNLTTRLHSYALCSHLIRAYPGVLTDYLHPIVDNIRSTLSDCSADDKMKIETLRFISLILTTHNPDKLNHFVETVLPLLARAVGDQFYKTSGQALQTTQSILYVLKNQKSDAIANKFIPIIYTAVLQKLKLTDVDQEVKEKTILTAGLLISIFSTELGSKITDECLPLLLDRLHNEMTRQVTLRAINIFVNSTAKVELQAILPGLLSICAEFLRKNQRPLRLNTLILLESLVNRFSHNGLQGPDLIKVVKEIPALISEQDLQITQIAITFITSVVNSYPDQILAEPLSNLFKSLIALVQSSLLEGTTLGASLRLFTALIRSPLPNKPTFEEIMSRLSEPVHLSSGQLLHRQTYISIAKATATVALATGDQRTCPESAQFVLKLGDALTMGSASESVRLFSMLTLGEIGRQFGQIIESLANQFRSSPEQLIIDSFASPLEEIKSAASYALGSLAVGNLAKYLPFLLGEISKQERKQYLFLHALKEVINSECDERGILSEADNVFRQNANTIWKLLLKYCDSSEGSIRSVVAECIGRLCVINPQLFINKLLEHTKDPSANVRATVVTALRFIMLEQPRPVDDCLRSILGQFLGSIRDQDLNVRRVAIVTLNSAAHNKPKLLKECLPELLPSLYEETKVKQELVREVKMGPFKHVVDDGLDLRKAAFECMYTLADHCLDRVNLSEYLTYVENGLKDSHDIQLLAYLMLSRLVNKYPIHMSQRLDGFCEQIKPQLMTHPKLDAVKQESDKQEELKRSAVRAVIALKRVPNSDRSQKLVDIWEVINSNPELTAIMKEVQTREQQIWDVNGDAMEVE